MRNSSIHRSRNNCWLRLWRIFRWYLESWNRLICDVVRNSSFQSTKHEGTFRDHHKERICIPSKNIWWCPRSDLKDACCESTRSNLHSRNLISCLAKRTRQWRGRWPIRSLKISQHVLRQHFIIVSISQTNWRAESKYQHYQCWQSLHWWTLR